MRKDYIGTIDYKSSHAFQHYSKGICKCLKAEYHDISVVEAIKLQERVDMKHEEITIAESRDHARRLGNIYGQDRGTGFAGNVWDKNFVSPTITTCQGGGREPHICEVMKVKRVGFIDNGTGQHQSNTVYDTDGVSPGITTIDGGTQQIKICDAQALRMVRTEEGKALRKAYENHEIHHGFNEHRQAEPMEDGCANTLSTVLKDNHIIETQKISTEDYVMDDGNFNQRGRNPENPSDRTAGIHLEQRLEPQEEGICNCLTSVQKDNLVLEKKTVKTIKIKQATKEGFVDLEIGGVVDLEYPNSKTRRGRVIDGGQVAPTTTTTTTVPYLVELGNPNFYNFLYEIDGELYLIRIRKLIPLECFRLMGVSDKDYEKAAYETKDVKEVFLCYAKSKGVIEKLSQNDTETYVLNITNDLVGRAAMLTEWTQYQNEQENGSNLNVNIVIEKSEKKVYSECAISITKCLEYMEMLYTLKTELDQHHTAIIEWERTGKPNTARYMRITLEESLSLQKLCIILMAIELIMQSTIYTSILQQVNIRGFIANSVDSSSNTVVKISNLKMDAIYTRTSASQLYKQAGNSIVVTVLMGIFSQLGISGVRRWNDMTEDEINQMIVGCR